MLDLARRAFPDIEAVFVDTGLEFPEIRGFVKTKENVVWLKPEMNFRKVIAKYGYPLISKEVSAKIYNARRGGYCVDRFDDNSEYVKKYGQRYSLAKWNWLKDSDIPIGNQCCNVMKKKPAKAYEKASGKKPMVATMTCESAQREQVWLRTGCDGWEQAKRVIKGYLSNQILNSKK